MTAQGETPEIASYVHSLGVAAQRASQELARAPAAARNAALQAMADAIEANSDTLRSENAKDLEAGRGNGLAAALLDRLELTPERIQSMADGVREVAALADPIGEITDMSQQPSGLTVGKMRVPLGVIGIIYESRPNVTIDAAVLCLKAGNATILRGGSEAIHSNLAIAKLIEQGLQAAGLPAACVQVINTPDRAAVSALLQMDEFVDVVIPRGGKGLIQRVSEDARVPVLYHLDGICHVYVDDHADLQMAEDVAFNSKTYRYGICGSMETLLVHVQVAAEFLPRIGARFTAHGVEMRACARAMPLLEGSLAASEEDWGTEYLGPVVSVRVVDDLDDAMEHIQTHGSHHTDAIITNDLARSQRFLREVDSASVMVNAATCFADGNQYGLGAEIGISTGKLHARGPVGVVGLTSQKFIVLGEGAIRG
ncbi:MAG: glutamate-5-semialdehyde dehydrogenase [Granulosicoccaceae bacterium]